MKNCSTIKSDEFCINVYLLNQNLFWKGRSWKAWGRATEPDLVTKLPNPIYTVQMHIASFPFMKINSVFQMSLRGKKKDFSGSKADKHYVGTADFYLLDQLSIL